MELCLQTFNGLSRIGMKILASHSDYWNYMRNNYLKSKYAGILISTMTDLLKFSGLFLEIVMLFGKEFKLVLII